MLLKANLMDRVDAFKDSKSLWTFKNASFLYSVQEFLTWKPRAATGESYSHRLG